MYFEVVLNNTVLVVFLSLLTLIDFYVFSGSQVLKLSNGKYSVQILSTVSLFYNIGF